MGFVREVESQSVRLDNRVSEGFSRRKASQFSAFLKALGEAIEYSVDLSASPWDFALRCSQAKSYDVNCNDLQWMLRKGWIKHRDIYSSVATSVNAGEIGETSCFIISEVGLDVARDFFHESPVYPMPGCDVSDGRSANPAAAATEKPSWNFERRELIFLGKVVKRFRWPAPNQEMILGVFAEEGWPAKIVDPLPQENGLEPKRRLGDTIKCLNRNQFSRLIRFRGDGTGEGVLWERLIAQ